jgi:hypothetical protein
LKRRDGFGYLPLPFLPQAGSQREERLEFPQ